jgi:hypothetical protein
MKIILDGVEISATPGSRIHYDGSTATLHLNGQPAAALDPITPPALAAPGKLLALPAPASAAHPDMQHDELKQTIVGLLQRRGAAMRGTEISMLCLGLKATAPKRKYLKIMLDQMVENGELTRRLLKNGNGMYLLASVPPPPPTLITPGQRFALRAFELNDLLKIQKLRREGKSLCEIADNMKRKQKQIENLVHSGRLEKYIADMQ